MELVLRRLIGAIWAVVAAAIFDGCPTLADSAKDGSKARTDVDTEHIFGITEGADIGKQSEQELEITPLLRFDKKSGTYFASSTGVAYKYGVTNNLRVAPTITISSHDIGNVAGFEDRDDFSIQSLSAEVRYAVMKRETGPFGITLSLEPAYTRSNLVSGAKVEQYGVPIAILMDKELIRGGLYGVLNVQYDPEQAAHNSASALLFAGALSAVVRPGWFVGIEARYHRQYSGLAFDTFVGDAFFLGPSTLITLSDSTKLTLAWNTQILGSAIGEPGNLNLLDFERRQFFARLSIGLN